MLVCNEETVQMFSGVVCSPVVCPPVVCPLASSCCSFVQMVCPHGPRSSGVHIRSSTQTHPPRVLTTPATMLHHCWASNTSISLAVRGSSCLGRALLDEMLRFHASGG